METDNKRQGGTPYTGGTPQMAGERKKEINYAKCSIVISIISISFSLTALLVNIIMSVKK